MTLKSAEKLLQRKLKEYTTKMKAKKYPITFINLRVPNTFEEEENIPTYRPIQDLRHWYTYQQVL